MDRVLGRSRAFTLVELIVVMVILAILIALGMFAARSFLHRGYDMDAQSRLTEVAQAQQSLSSTYGSYSENSADFRALSGDTSVTHVAASRVGVVSASVSAQGTAGLATRSSSGKCFYTRVAPLVRDGAVTDVSGGVPSSAPCHGSEALPDGEAWTQADAPLRVTAGTQP